MLIFGSAVSKRLGDRREARRKSSLRDKEWSRSGEYGKKQAPMFLEAETTAEGTCASHTDLHSGPELYLCDLRQGV